MNVSNRWMNHTPEESKSKWPYGTDTFRKSIKTAKENVYIRSCHLLSWQNLGISIDYDKYKKTRGIHSIEQYSGDNGAELVRSCST